MKKDIFNKVLNNEIKNSLNGEKLIKEIVFEEDIDKDKSDKYFVDKEDGVLHFLYHISDTVYADDLLGIFGEVSGDGQSISMFSRIENSIKDTVKRSHTLVTKPIQQDSDIIEIDFNHNSNGVFYYHFINEYNCKLRKKFASGDLQYTSESCSNKLNELTTSTFDGNSLNISRYKGYDLCNYNNFYGLSCDYPIKYVVNLKSGFSFVIQEHIKKVFFDFRNITDSYHYILLVYNQKLKIHENIAFLINRISYGIQDGYVYMKPILTNGNLIKVKMLFSGNPEIQYYSSGSKCWKTVGNFELIKCEAEIQYRLKMTYGDSIYKLYFLKA